MADSTLTFRVKADTGAAAASFSKLGKSLGLVDKSATSASKSIDKISKSKVQPKVDVKGFSKLDQAIHKATQELDKLHAEMADKVLVGADTKDTQAKIRRVKADLKTLQAERTKLQVAADTAPATKNIGKLKGVLRALKGERAKIGISADTTAAAAGIARVKAAVRALKTQSAKINVDVGLTGGGAAERGVSGLKKGFLTTASEISNVAAALGPIVGGVASGIVKLGSAAVGGALDMLKLADSLENNKIAFTTMLGSGQKADKFLAGLEKFAAKTPFSFDELTSASKKMLAFGFSAKDIIPTLTTIGDAAGNTGADVNQLATIFGQMKAKGKLATEDIVQLVEAGIPAWDILAEKLGVSKQKVQELATEGKLSGKALDQLLKGVEQRFGGGMAKQAETLSGLISTLKDTWDQTKTKIGTAIAPFAKVALKGLQTGLDGFAETLISKIPKIIDSIESFALRLVDLPGDIARFGGNFISGIYTIKASFESAIAGLLTSVGSMMGSIAQIIRPLAVLNPLLAPLADSLEDSSKTALESSGKMSEAAKQSGKDAETQKKKWDDWATAYDKAAAKYKDGIKAGAAKARIVFAAGQVNKEISTLQDKLSKLELKPKANASEIKKVKGEIVDAKNQLDIINAYQANPKILAADLASGKVVLDEVTGKLKVIDGMSPEIKIQVQKQAEKDLKDAKKALDDIDGTKAKPKVGVDVTAAKLEVSRLQGELDALSGKEAKPKAGLDKTAYQAAYDDVIEKQGTLDGDKATTKTGMDKSEYDTGANAVTTKQGEIGAVVVKPGIGVDKTGYDTGSNAVTTSQDTIDKSSATAEIDADAGKYETATNSILLSLSKINGKTATARIVISAGGAVGSANKIAATLGRVNKMRARPSIALNTGAAAAAANKIAAGVRGLSRIHAKPRITFNTAAARASANAVANAIKKVGAITVHPKIHVDSNAATVVGSTKGLLNSLPSSKTIVIRLERHEQRIIDPTVDNRSAPAYDFGGMRPRPTPLQQQQVYRPLININQPPAVLPPINIELAFRDEALAGLIDVRVAGAAAQVRRVTRRREVLT